MVDIRSSGVSKATDLAKKLSNSLQIKSQKVENEYETAMKPVTKFSSNVLSKVSSHVDILKKK